MGAPVVAHRDAAPVLELAEHALDQVALAVPLFVVFDRRLAALATRNTGLDFPALQRGAEPIAIITPVGDHDIGVRQGRQHGRRALVVAHLALREQQYQGLALAITDRVQL